MQKIEATYSEDFFWNELSARYHSPIVDASTTYTFGKGKITVATTSLELGEDQFYEIMSKSFKKEAKKLAESTIKHLYKSLCPRQSIMSIIFCGMFPATLPFTQALTLATEFQFKWNTNYEYFFPNEHCEKIPKLLALENTNMPKEGERSQLVKSH